MVEVQVRQDHHVDIARRNPHSFERAQQYVLRFEDAVALAHVWSKERSDAGFEEDRSSTCLAYEERPASKVDSILVVGRRPAGPYCTGAIAKHCAAVEPLAVPANGV
jgi:hypothetical protein